MGVGESSARRDIYSMKCIHEKRKIEKSINFHLKKLEKNNINLKQAEAKNISKIKNRLKISKD